MLRPGGRLLVLDTDWDSIVWHSTRPHRMERVLAAWNEHLAHPYLPRRLPGLLRDAGLEPTDVAIIPILNVGANRETYSAGHDRAHRRLRRRPRRRQRGRGRRLGAGPRGLGDDYFFSLNRYLFVAQRS